MHVVDLVYRHYGVNGRPGILRSVGGSNQTNVWVTWMNFARAEGANPLDQPFAHKRIPLIHRSRHNVKNPERDGRRAGSRGPASPATSGLRICRR